MARESAYRVAIANANVPNMLGQISTAMAQAGLNIHNMVNKSRGDMAYTLVDVDSAVEEPVPTAAIDGVCGALSWPFVTRPRGTPPRSARRAAKPWPPRPTSGGTMGAKQQREVERMTNAFAPPSRASRPASAASGQFYSPAGAGQAVPQHPAAAGVDAHRAGVGAAQLRRQEGHGRARRAGRQLAAQPPSARRDPVHRGPRGAAGLHRRAAAGRPGGDAQRGAASWARTSAGSSRWCRWTWWSTTRSWSTTTAPRTRST